MSDNCDLRDFIDELNALGAWIEVFGQLLSAIAATLQAEQKQRVQQSEAMLEERVWQLEQQLRTLLEGLQQAASPALSEPHPDYEHGQEGDLGNPAPDNLKQV